MIVRCCSLLAIAAAAASSAAAGIVYEPVRIEYGNGQRYYYAGDNPAIHAAAAYPYVPGTNFGRVGGFAFVNDRREVVQRFPRLFTDALGPVDGRTFGLTINQVANEANARVPQFFPQGGCAGDGKAGRHGVAVCPGGSHLAAGPARHHRHSPVRPAAALPASAAAFVAEVDARSTDRRAAATRPRLTVAIFAPVGGSIHWPA